MYPSKMETFLSRILHSRQHRHLCQLFSRGYQASSISTKQIYVWEETISSSTKNAYSNANGKKEKETLISSRKKGRVLYKSVNNNQGDSIGWEKVITTPSHPACDTNSNVSISSIWNSCKKSKDFTEIQNLPLIHHFLPARYPSSVCPSYATYASYCFLGSVAGSSAMVLSTQALLIAVGVGDASAAPMAGALNWVMKDGIGQLGGVIFASQLGRGGLDFDYWRNKFQIGWLGSLRERMKNNNITNKRGNFQRGTADSNPKRWRMVAALALDLSTLLEICTPMMGSHWFLPMASIANIGKNVGFLAASASRAAIHQSLSMGGSTTPTKSNSLASSNLGDVTAKSGSQSIVASLAGTAIGIFFSRTFSDYGTAGIFAGFVFLSAIHQVSTYKAVQAVPLRTLDRHRLHIILNNYVTENYSNMVESVIRNNKDSNAINVYKSKIMTPKQVAEEESFIPLLPPDESIKWLSIGDSLMDICPRGLEELEELMHRTYDRPNNYEKYILKATQVNDGVIQLTFFESASDEDLLRGMLHAYISHEQLRRNHVLDKTTSYTMMKIHMPIFLKELQEAGWRTEMTGYVNIECGSSHRLRILNA